MGNIRLMGGVPDAIKVSVGMGDHQSVTVTDGPKGLVHLDIGRMTYPAALTPEQARYIAQLLIDSADRSAARPDAPQQGEGNG